MLQSSPERYNLNGAKLLTSAVREGREDLVSYILGLPGVEVDDIDNHGNTALMYNCMRRRTFDGRIMRQLLDAGANVNYRYE